MSKDDDLGAECSSALLPISMQPARASVLFDSRMDNVPPSPSSHPKLDVPAWRGSKNRCPVQRRIGTKQPLDQIRDRASVASSDLTSLSVIPLCRAICRRARDVLRRGLSSLIASSNCGPTGRSSASIRQEFRRDAARQSARTSRRANGSPNVSRGARIQKFSSPGSDCRQTVLSPPSDSRT